MRIAVSVWKDRIAPVFDVAQTILLIDVENAESAEPERIAMPEPDRADRGAYLAQCGVQELICGAISRCSLQQVEAHGIRVYGFLGGTFSELLEAWKEGRLGETKFAMPGCQGRQCRNRGRGHGKCPANSQQQEEISSCNLKQGGRNHARRRRNRPIG